MGRNKIETFMCFFGVSYSRPWSAPPSTCVQRKKSKMKYPILAAMNLIPYNKKKNTNLLGIIIIHSEAGYRKSVKFTVTVKYVGK